MLWFDLVPASKIANGIIQRNELSPTFLIERGRFAKHAATAFFEEGLPIAFNNDMPWRIFFVAMHASLR